MEPEQPRRSWQIALALLVAAVLAWSGLLDQTSETWVDGALLSTGAVYATARGINALVSVLQGTEMNVLVLTLSVGELLDPVNDLIERFSALLLLALGSLALQKILLGLVSHTAFNILLTLCALAVLAARHWGSPGGYRWLTRLCIVTIALRFSLALVVVVNHGVDSIFLQQNEQERHAAVMEFKSELSAVTEQACLEQGDSAESCASKGWWSTTRDTLDIRPKIAALEQQVDAFAANLVNLLMSLLLKSILAPLAFLYCLLRLLRGIWP